MFVALYRDSSFPFGWKLLQRAARFFVLDCSHALGLPSFVFIVITDLLAHLDVGPISATQGSALAVSRGDCQSGVIFGA